MFPWLIITRKEYLLRPRGVQVNMPDTVSSKYEIGVLEYIEELR